jgi:hypothetical protein
MARPTVTHCLLETLGQLLRRCLRLMHTGFTALARLIKGYGNLRASRQRF